MIQQKDAKVSETLRGRPRNTRLDSQIRTAAWDLIAEIGCEALSFEAIAQRVKCSRSTLYRRFSSKADLISHLLNETARSFEPRFDVKARPRDKLLAHAATCARMYADNKGSALLHIAAQSHQDPDIASAFKSHQDLVAPHYRRPMKELAPMASESRINFALQTLLGSIVHHVAIRNCKLSSSEITRLVDAAIGLTEK